MAGRAEARHHVRIIRTGMMSVAIGLLLPAGIAPLGRVLAQEGAGAATASPTDLAQAESPAPLGEASQEKAVDTAAQTQADMEARAIASEIFDAMHFGEMIPILAKEGQDYGNSLSGAMFPARQAPDWEAAVSEIYDPALLEQRYLDALAAAITGKSAEMGGGLDFLKSDLGQMIARREVETRARLLDEAEMEAAEVAGDKLRQGRSPRLRQIDKLIAAGDFVETNVASGLSGLLAFNEGVAEATPVRSVVAAQTKQEMMAQVWAQEPEFRRNTTDWLTTFMVAAYEPLTEAELAAYIDFMGSEAGRALYHAIFTGFDQAFRPSMRALGREAGLVMQGRAI